MVRDHHYLVNNSSIDLKGYLISIFPHLLSFHQTLYAFLSEWALIYSAYKMDEFPGEIHIGLIRFRHGSICDKERERSMTDILQGWALGMEAK